MGRLAAAGIRLYGTAPLCSELRAGANLRTASPACKTIERVPKPLVAAIEGS